MFLLLFTSLEKPSLVTEPVAVLAPCSLTLVPGSHACHWEVLLLLARLPCSGVPRAAVRLICVQRSAWCVVCVFWVWEGFSNAVFLGQCILEPSFFLGSQAGRHHCNRADHANGRRVGCGWPVSFPSETPRRGSWVGGALGPGGCGFLVIILCSRNLIYIGPSELASPGTATKGEQSTDGHQRSLGEGVV